MPPSVSGLFFQDLAGRGGGGGEERGIGPQQSCPLTFKFVPTGLVSMTIFSRLRLGYGHLRKAKDNAFAKFGPSMQR